MTLRSIKDAVADLKEPLDSFVKIEVTLPLKSIAGFGFSVAAYSLLFFWPALLSMMIFAEFGPMPYSSAPSQLNYLHYDFMIAAFHVETVWTLLFSVCLISAALFSSHLN